MGVKSTIRLSRTEAEERYTKLYYGCLNASQPVPSRVTAGPLTNAELEEALEYMNDLPFRAVKPGRSGPGYQAQRS